MQRKLILLFVVLLFLGVLTAVGQAQIDPTTGQPADEGLIIVETPPQQMIDGVFSLSEGANGRNAILVPISLAAGEPADTCELAPLLVVAPNINDGGVANTRLYSEEASDPVLACMWGNPSRSKGYRTMWYRLVAPVSGRVTLDTFNSRTDTVLSVYSGTCDDLIVQHCNDDFNGFTSQVTVTIEEGQTYFVQIADWQPGVVPDPVMQLAVLLQPVDSKWELITSKPATPAISRHAVVAQGENVYVIGGQTSVPNDDGVPQVSNQLLQFNTAEKRWTQLQQIPGVGYSNTTAALVGSRIYLPSGYTGNDLGYDGLHWYYDIGRNSWFTAASIPTVDLPDGRPFAWASAVVPPSQNRYYLTGGMSSTQPLAPTANVSAETYVYLPSADSWIKLKPMQAARYAHTAGWIETNNLGICVAGGLGVGTDPESGDPVTILHRSVECYQPGGNWSYHGDLNIPRFGAGSVVGPDGKWYVFGGTTVDGLGFRAVARTEVYDPILNTWTVMEPSYNLGTFQTMPPRFWPRGAMVGNDLWVVGGSILEPFEQALPTIDRITIPSQTIRLPVVSADYDDAQRPDDNFAQARQMAVGGQQRRNFDTQFDFFDYYTFELTSPRQVTIQLEVPENNNFDLELYGQNKLLRGSATNPRQGEAGNEYLSIFLPRLRYYVVVKRSFPTGQPDKNAYYTLKVN